MGRFDLLTQLEERKNTSAPSPVVTIPANTPPSTVVKDQSSAPKKTTKPQTRLPTNQPPTLGSFEKPEKYTTHLEPSLVKKLKLYATERDMKDYQVIKKALLLYFEKLEKNK